MTQNISGGRKAAYYVGAVIMIVVGLMFASTFLTFALNFGNFDHFEARSTSMMLRAFGGMFLIVVGGIIGGLGARGLAGSGAVLDPKQTGGMATLLFRVAMLKRQSGPLTLGCSRQAI